MMETGVPTTPNSMSCLFVDYGWSWSDELLARFTKWLADQNIEQRLDLVQLDLSDLSGVEQWPREASSTLRTQRLQRKPNLHICQVQIFLTEVLKGHPPKRKRLAPPPCVVEGEEAERSTANIAHVMPCMVLVVVRCAKTSVEEISRIHASSGTVLHIKNTKPCAALRVLAAQLGGSEENRRKWRDEARVAAIMGSCPRSKASHDSGKRFARTAWITRAF